MKRYCSYRVVNSAYKYRPGISNRKRSISVFWIITVTSGRIWIENIFIPWFNSHYWPKDTSSTLSSIFCPFAICMSAIPAKRAAVFRHCRVIIRKNSVRATSLGPIWYQVVIDKVVHCCLPQGIYIGHNVDHHTDCLLVAVKSELFEAHVVS